MNIIDGKPYRFLEVLINLFLLNFIWLIACIPIITAFPATAALFGVVREWIKESDTAVVEPFLRHFRANFKQSLLIGVIWSLLGALLIADFVLIGNMEEWIKIPLYFVLAAGLLCYIMTSVYLFPVMVTYEGRWSTVIKNSFFISISQLGITVLCILDTAIFLLAILYLNVALLIAGSGLAFSLYALCRLAFKLVERQKGIRSEIA